MQGLWTVTARTRYTVDFIDITGEFGNVKLHPCCQFAIWKDTGFTRLMYNSS